MERDNDGKGCYGVLVDMLPEVELTHLAPFTGMQMFSGNPKPRMISFMHVSGIENMHDYIISNGWENITPLKSQPWGGKTCDITTVDGYRIRVFE